MEGLVKDIGFLIWLCEANGKQVTDSEEMICGEKEELCEMEVPDPKGNGRLCSDGVRVRRGEVHREDRRGEDGRL